ncbi:MAG: HD-GYP domain-containing protein [Eubacteriales bacterium]
MGKESSYIVNDMHKVIDHGNYVSRLAYLIGKEMRLEEKICYELAIAGVVHDIGKLRLNRYLYDKQNDLTKEDIRYIRMHSKLSYDILKDKGYSKFILDAVLYHHENYDGSGYPENLRGEEIPLGARILRVSDVFSALISDRPYRKGFNQDMAIKMMIDEAKNYDLRVFMAFQMIINNIESNGEKRLNA